jgi:hypothetical protein
MDECHWSRSPDPNAIENLWRQLKLKLGRMNRRATSLDELWEQIQQAWDELDIGMVNRLIDSMEGRRLDVAAAKGGYTRFWLYLILTSWKETPLLCCVYQENNVAHLSTALERNTSSETCL